MRRVLSIVVVSSLAAFLWVLAGCDAGEVETGNVDATDPSAQLPPSGSEEAPPIDRAIFPEVGARDFITANENELLSAGTTGTKYYDRGYNAGAAFDEDGAEVGGMEPGTSEPEPMPEPDMSREIVEADIFALEGDTLYVLNSYRGLLIVDMSNPDQPEVLGRLPFQAHPVDMYVRDGRAYIVISDYFVYWQWDPDADPLGFHGSQVLIADVSDPTNPVEMGSMLVEGEVTDTRMVGDVLYTVSKRNAEYWRYNTADWEDRTWVASLNLSDPSNIEEIDRITFQGTSTLIHVAPHAIFVAAVDPNYYLTSEDYEQETLVTYVDISDSDGDLRERDGVYIPGYIADKFKMDYHDATLRVFSQRWYGANDGYIFSVDVSYPDDLEIVGSLEVGTDDYGYLEATRFAGERAFAMTNEYYSGYDVEKLHTFDLSDPTLPRRAASLQIDMDISHMVVRGDRLLGLGRTDYIMNAGRLVQLAIYDVSDLEAPAELSKVRLGERYSYSNAINDYKALRIVDELGLILVPLSYYDQGHQTYFQGTQIVEWSDDVLTERGRVRNVAQVKRAIAVGDRLVAFSERQLQVIDPSDLDNPVVTADMFLIRNVLDIFRVQDLQVQLVGDIEDGGFFFEVLEFGAEDDAPALARLDLPYYSQPFCVRDDDVIHMVGFEQEIGQTVRNADFQSVLDPSLRGLLELSNEADSIYHPGYSFYYYYWNPTSGLAADGDLMPFTERHIVELPNDRREWNSELKFVDMSDIDNPRIADGSVPMNDYPFVNKVEHGRVLHSTHVEEATTEAGETLLYHVRSYVDRIDASDPDNPLALSSLNVPGMLIDTSEDSELLYTIDYQWDDFGRRRNSLNVLRVVGEDAELTEVIPVGDQIDRAVFRDRTIWTVAHKYPWWGVHSDTVSSRQPYTVLIRYTVGEDGTLQNETRARLHGYHFELLDVEGDRMYLSSRSPYGLLVLDVSNAAEPTVLHAARSIGYISKIVSDEDYLYTPLGWYGVHRTGIE